jgi:CBS-domain-containing membrane protein
MIPPLTPRRLAAALAAGTGAAIAIGLMEWVSEASQIALGSIPFATSIVLVMATPDAAPSRPRALIGGHLLSAAMGLVIVHTLGPGAWTAALAVGLALAAMVLTDTLHPPAGIDPLLVVTGHLPWTFLLMPVAAGALSLWLFAAAWTALTRRAGIAPGRGGGDSD